MDTPTAMAMATTYGVALLGRRAGVAGGLLCAFGALLPDLDAVAPVGTTEFVTWHRGPTHSLVFLVVMTPVLAGLARLLRSRRPFRWLCAAAALGLTVGIVSDLLTWWGTVVLWPFDNGRYGIGLIFIIDLWHSAIVAAPFLAWGVQRLRGRPFPWRAFRVAAVTSVAWFALLTTSMLQARGVATDLAAARDGDLLDVLPQPVSPFRWNVVVRTGAERRCLFIDHLAPGEVVEERVFRDPTEAVAVQICEESEAGRLIRWFHRLPHTTTASRDDGGVEVVFEDLAYQIRLPGWQVALRSIPFRYRFVVGDGEVLEQGWIDED